MNEEAIFKELEDLQKEADLIGTRLNQIGKEPATIENEAKLLVLQAELKRINERLTVIDHDLDQIEDEEESLG